MKLFLLRYGIFQDDSAFVYLLGLSGKGSMGIPLGLNGNSHRVKQEFPSLLQYIHNSILRIHDAQKFQLSF